MSLISTNSKVERSPAHYSNNFPQAIVIEPNSQICLQKFIHSRDADLFEVSAENNALMFKFGSTLSTPQSVYNPERNVVLNTGTYSGADLATEIERAISTEWYQQNFKLTVTFAEDVGAIPPAISKTFTFNLTQPDAAEFPIKGGEWSTGVSSNLVEIVNDDTVNRNSKITFKEENTEYGDNVFMRRGILTHGGIHSTSGIRRDATTGVLDGITCGIVANAISRDTGIVPPANGAGFDFGEDFQDIAVAFDTAGQEEGAEEIVISELFYGTGNTKPGNPNWRRNNITRILPAAFVEALFGGLAATHLTCVITTTQEDIRGDGVTSQWGGDFIVQLKYTTGDGTTAFVPDNTGGTIAQWTEGAPAVPIVKTLEIGTQELAPTYPGCIFYSGNKEWYQFKPPPAGAVLFGNKHVRASRAPYIPTVTTAKGNKTEYIHYYDLPEGNAWVQNNNANFDLTFSINPAYAEGTSEYIYKCERKNLGVVAQTFWFRLTNPQGTATINTPLLYEYVGVAALPPDNTTKTGDATLDISVPATPTIQFSGAGATYSGSAEVNEVLDNVRYFVQGQYNLTTNQASPPLGLTETLKYVDTSVGEAVLEGTNTLSLVGVGSPAGVPSLPRNFQITFEAMTGGVAVATIGRLLGFQVPVNGGDRNYYSNGSMTSTGVLPDYPWALVNQNQPISIASNMTLHISITQLNNIRTYEGARTDLLPGATINNGASNGDITNTIAVIPRQEFVTAVQGQELVYVAPYENWVDLNNAGTMYINQLTVLVRNADGTVSSDLVSETTAIFKLRQDPLAKAQEREDQRMERFTKMILNQQDRTVAFTGS